MASRVQLCQSVLYSFLNQNFCFIWSSLAALGFPVGFFTAEPPGKALIGPAALLKAASCQPSPYYRWGEDFPGSLNLLSWSECLSSLPPVHPSLYQIQPLVRALERTSSLPLQHSCSGLYPLIPPWTVFSVITLLALSPPPPCLFLQLLVCRNTVSETTFLSLTSPPSGPYCCVLDRLS